MKKRRKTPHIDKKEITKIDPMLGKPTDDIEQNVAKGIDEIVPDPDDVPGGVKPDLTLMPDLTEADAEALVEEEESPKTLPERKPVKK